MKISFIVPVYNAEQYLEQCILSIIRIQSTDIEIILINDGSTDGSEKICNMYRELDQRIRILNQDNLGVSVARNNGIKMAVGEWVCFVDADDLLSTEFENDIIKKIDTNYEIIFYHFQDFVGDHAINRENQYEVEVDYEKEDIRCIRTGLLNVDNKDFKDYLSDSLDYVAPWGCLYRKDIIEKCKFPEGIIWSEDRIFKFEYLGKVQKAKVLPGYGYFYRKHEGSVTFSFKENTMSNCQKMCACMKKIVREENSAIFLEAFDLFVVRQFLFALRRSVYHKNNFETYKQRIDHVRKYRETQILAESIEKISIFNYNKIIIKVPALLFRKRCYWLLDILYRLRRKW